jgi:hypothetical protein
VAVHTAPLAELVSQAEATIEHCAIAAVDAAMMAVIAHGGLMEQRINNEVKSAVRAAINNIVDRKIQPLVQDTIDNIFISYRDSLLTERQQAKSDITAHRTSVELAFHAAVDDTIYEFQQVVDTITLDNMAMIDNAIRTANDAFEAKRASIIKSIKVAICAAGTPHMPPAPLPWTSSTDDPQPPTSFSPPKSPAQPPAREHAQHGGAHPGLPKRSLWTPPINNYRPSNTRSSHHPCNAPPSDTYPPYYATGPCARYDEDSVRYGGGT